MRRGHRAVRHLHYFEFIVLLVPGPAAARTGIVRMFRAATLFDGDQRQVNLAARSLRGGGAAARYYRKALDQDPVNSPIWVQYGHALKESGSVLEAENAY